MKKYTAEQLLSPEYSELVERIESLLTLSFAEDPIHKWLFSSHSSSEYVKVLGIYFRVLLRLCLLSDASVSVVADGDDISTLQAVSVLIPPHGNATFDSTIAAIRAGIVGFFYQLGVARVYRLMGQFLPNLHKMYEVLFPDPSAKHNVYLLMFLATHPDRQGHGLGTRLLLEEQAHVKAANETAVSNGAVNGKEITISPLYLESSSVTSKRLYERLGFEHRGTMTYGKAGEEDSAQITEDGTVLGGKQFGMFWIPPIKVASGKVTSGEGSV